MANIDNVRLMDDNKAYVAVRTEADLQKVLRRNEVADASNC